MVWRPFLLGPIFNSQGWKTSPFNIYHAKGTYMWRDMERRCAARGLTFGLHIVTASTRWADFRAAMRDLSLLVDLECDDACRSRLEHHLAGCPDCRDWIVATADPEGIWIECACDVGYAGAKIRVLLT